MRTIDALQRALEFAGVEFTNGDQPGVRLAKVASTRIQNPPARENRPLGESSPWQDRQGDREKTIGPVLCLIAR